MNSATFAQKCLVFALAVMIVGALVCLHASIYKHPHTQVNGFMLIIWGALLLGAVVSERYNFFAHIGMWIGIAGAMLSVMTILYAYYYGLNTRSHLAGDGMLLLIEGIVLMALSEILKGQTAPQKTPR